MSENECWKDNRHMINEKGAEYLSDKNLLCVLFDDKIDDKKISALLRSDIPIENMSIEDLHNFVTKKQAVKIATLFELTRRRFKRNNRISIRKPEDLLPRLEGIRDKQQEYFMCATLNGANELIEMRTITIGLLNSSQVHPREVFADALMDRAASIILAHNHPSGTLEPSKADTMITRQLCESGKLLGIEVLDHLIVSEDGWISLQDKGYM